MLQFVTMLLWILTPASSDHPGARETIVGAPRSGGPPEVSLAKDASCLLLSMTLMSLVFSTLFLLLVFVTVRLPPYTRPPNEGH